MEAIEREVCAPLTPQPGPREKASQLERLRALLADLEDHQVALSSLEEKAREMFKKTGDASFNHGARTQLQAQFDDLTALVEVGQGLGSSASQAALKTGHETTARVHLLPVSFFRSACGLHKASCSSTNNILRL